MVLSQMFIGIANIFFLTPLVLQITHLLVADLLWIVYVVFGASLMADEVPSMQRPRVSA